MPQLMMRLYSINGSLKTYRPSSLTWVVFLSIAIQMHAQTPDPVQAIHDLRDGYLLVRIPAFKGKIEALETAIRKTTDDGSKQRLEKQLQDTREERDSLLAQYTRAFREVYDFSKSGYFFDYEGRDPGTAHIYKMDGTPLSREELSLKPVFYLYFEKTTSSHLDGLVIHDASGQVIPSPFPNNFVRGGINFLFLKFSAKKFPEWRVKRMDRQLKKFLSMQSR